MEVWWAITHRFEDRNFALIEKKIFKNWITCKCTNKISWYKIQFLIPWLLNFTDCPSLHCSLHIQASHFKTLTIILLQSLHNLTIKNIMLRMGFKLMPLRRPTPPSWLFFFFFFFCIIYKSLLTYIIHFGPLCIVVSLTVLKCVLVMSRSWRGLLDS